MVVDVDRWPPSSSSSSSGVPGSTYARRQQVEPSHFYLTGKVVV